MGQIAGLLAGRGLMLAISLVVMSMLLYAVQKVPDIRSRALEAEGKQQLHQIQLAVERFSVDSPGNIYPAWLCGGSMPEAPHDRWLAEDVLLAEGYLTSYPVNPFSKSDRKLGRQLAELQELVNDPWRLRAGSNMQPPAWRFGADCSLMGCISVEPIVASREHNRDFDNFDGLLIPASVRYPYRSESLTRNSAHWLQGQFVYQPRCGEDYVSVGAEQFRRGRDLGDAANYDVVGYTLWGQGSLRLFGKGQRRNH